MVQPENAFTLWHAEPDFEPNRFRALLREYVQRLLEVGAPEKAALGRLKQWLRLGAPAFAEVDALFQSIKRERSLFEALRRLDGEEPAAAGVPSMRREVAAAEPLRASG